jgi:serine/threonine-protein kinase
MGQIFLARQKGPVGFQKLVVVKRLLPHMTEEEEFLKMFVDEARIAALLNHPNIAQIYDLGEVDGTFFIAMEYVQGENLRQLAIDAQAQQGGLPLGLKLRIIADAAAGLDFAHKAKSHSGRTLNVIHRDVSPQNVLVGFNGGVKLIDFGVVKAANKVSQTLAGAIKGKYPYMSPEQARGDELDARSDIFGLGIVLHELLTHQRLFKRETDSATLKAVVGSRIPLPSELTKGIPPALDGIVLRALARKRDERYQTAGELQLALENLIAHERMNASVAHLSTYMHQLYEDDLEQERFANEPTQINFDVFAKDRDRDDSSTAKKTKPSGTGSARSHTEPIAEPRKKRSKGHS